MFEKDFHDFVEQIKKKKKSKLKNTGTEGVLFSRD